MWMRPEKAASFSPSSGESCARHQQDSGSKEMSCRRFCRKLYSFQPFQKFSVMNNDRKFFRFQQRLCLLHPSNLGCSFGSSSRCLFCSQPTHPSFDFLGPILLGTSFFHISTETSPKQAFFPVFGKKCCSSLVCSMSGFDGFGLAKYWGVHVTCLESYIIWIGTHWI